MGDAQRLSPDEQLLYAREQFESGTDLTLAVEEEFALVDPVSLDLVNRFEEVEAALQGTPLGEHLAGELISAEAEVRTGRCETFAEAVAKVAERRGSSSTPATRSACRSRPRARTRGRRGRTCG